MKVVVAPDSFKGSLSALHVAEAIAAGWRSVRPDDDLVLAPQADGGEGTLDAVAASVPGATVHSAGTVTGPDGRPVEGLWLSLPNGAAVVELAQPSGLPLMGTLDALGATSRGLGEVIAAALDAGAASLVIGLGGSASTDGAMGALSALGLVLTDEQGEIVPDGGGSLRDVVSVDRSALRPAPAGGVTLLSDVTAPLTGPTGAAAVFGPQKGADAQQIAFLDGALDHLAQLLGGDPYAPGAGSAGGAGYGFAAVWGAELRSGADHLADLTGLSARLADADVVLSGEGRFDDQSLAGKVVGQLLSNAVEHGARVGVIAGQVTATVDGVWTASLTELSGSVEAALGDTDHWLRHAGAAAARALGTP